MPAVLPEPSGRTIVSKFLGLSCTAVDDPRSIPTTAVIVAHPDDEVIEVGTRLPGLRRAIFVHVTDGAPRDLHDAKAAGFRTQAEYARARRRELEAALGIVGIMPEQTRQLGCVDQEAGLCLIDLSRRLASLLRELRPRIIRTLPYEGGHSDHDATAFAVHAARRLLEQQRMLPPLLMEMTSYHNGPRGIEVYDFLPRAGCQVTTCMLTEAERAHKRRLLDCFPTHRQTLSLFPVELERFRPAPRYNFTELPHEGQPFYENFP